MSKLRKNKERHGESPGLKKSPPNNMTMKSLTFEKALYSLTEMRISAFMPVGEYGSERLSHQVWCFPDFWKCPISSFSWIDGLWGAMP